MGQKKSPLGGIKYTTILTLGKAGRLTFANQLSQDSEVCAQTSKKVSSVNKDTKVYDVI